jgi:hypothetical protein
MIALLPLVLGGMLLFGLIAFCFKAIGLVLNLVLLPLKILFGGVLALGGLLSLALVLPLMAAAGVLALVGLTLGGLVLLARVLF